MQGENELGRQRETDDVGVVKASEEVDLCPDTGFVSLYSFFLDDRKGNVAGRMDEPEGVLAGRRETRGIRKNTPGRWHSNLLPGMRIICSSFFSCSGTTCVTSEHDRKAKRILVDG